MLFSDIQETFLFINMMSFLDGRSKSEGKGENVMRLNHKEHETVSKLCHKKKFVKCALCSRVVQKLLTKRSSDVVFHYL